MKSERVSCLTANCSYCQHGIKAGKTFYWGDALYICKAHPKKHKKIDAEDCGEFRCNKSKDYSILCRNCRRGK